MRDLAIAACGVCIYQFMQCNVRERNNCSIKNDIIDSRALADAVDAAAKEDVRAVHDAAAVVGPVEGRVGVGLDSLGGLLGAGEDGLAEREPQVVGHVLAVLRAHRVLVDRRLVQALAAVEAHLLGRLGHGQGQPRRSAVVLLRVLQRATGLYLEILEFGICYKYSRRGRARRLGWDERTYLEWNALGRLDRLEGLEHDAEDDAVEDYARENDHGALVAAVVVEQRLDQRGEHDRAQARAAHGDAGRQRSVLLEVHRHAHYGRQVDQPEAQTCQQNKPLSFDSLIL